MTVCVRHERSDLSMSCHNTEMICEQTSGMLATWIATVVALSGELVHPALRL